MYSTWYIIIISNTSSSGNCKDIGYFLICIFFCFTGNFESFLYTEYPHHVKQLQEKSLPYSKKVLCITMVHVLAGVLSSVFSILILCFIIVMRFNYQSHETHLGGHSTCTLASTNYKWLSHGQPVCDL